MKAALLTSFVAIAMASTASASVIPSYTAHHHDMTMPHRRATISSLEGKVNSAAAPVPADAILAPLPVARAESEGEPHSHGMGYPPPVSCVLEGKGVVCSKPKQEGPTTESKALRSVYHFGGLTHHHNSVFSRDGEIDPVKLAELINSGTLHSREDVDLATSDSKNNEDESDDSSADIQNLNLALLIQDASHAFFAQGLSRFQQEDFSLAGYPDWVRGRYLQIRDQKKVHLDFLKSAITTSGGEGVKEGEYQFHVNDIHSFVDLSEAITTIGTSSYIGAIHNFNNKEYVTVGAALLALEARQTGWINSAIRQQNPWNTAFETPLTSSQVITLLSSLSDLNFNSIASANPSLLPSSITPSPALTLSSQLIPGNEAELVFPLPSPPLSRDERLYATFLFGFETIFAPISERFYVQIPRDLDGKGTVFVSVLRGRGGMDAADGENVVAGPAIAVFPFGAEK
ncbi:ferritin-like domain-containing protein [Gymnopilus junonius]|uniref:Ferritin-like domain-containing protein n=1 Tax=Gymnopilus junonius TaxID=109634 RepID=A0A9P5NA33_GYMJU|nr:ferritin-like domain-containing protein [Gymnopilus junonius]